NAVRVTFAGGKITKIVPEQPDTDGEPGAVPVVVEWPLSPAPGAPVMRWTSEMHLVNQSLQIDDLQLSYQSHGVSWTLPPKPLTIPMAGTPTSIKYLASDFNPSGTPSAVSIATANLELNFKKDPQYPLGHTYDVFWRFVWGANDQLQLVATYAEHLVAAKLPA